MQTYVTTGRECVLSGVTSGGTSLSDAACTAHATDAPSRALLTRACVITTEQVNVNSLDVCALMTSVHCQQAKTMCKHIDKALHCNYLNFKGVGVGVVKPRVR